MLNINTQVIEIPESILANWQQNIALIAETLTCPCTIALQLYYNDLSVYCSSPVLSPSKVKQHQSLDFSFFSHHVVDNQTDLLVENAHSDPGWHAATFRAPNVAAYYGWPIAWPNQQVCGSVSLFGSEPQVFAAKSKLAIARFQQAVETDLALLFQHAEVLHQNRQLKSSYAKQSIDLQVLKQDLLHEQDSRAALESSLIYQQEYDALTGVANQLSFVKQVDAMLKQASETETAIVYLGLRNFKSINNSYGYTIGDKVLLEISQRIHQQLTTEYLVGRCWGDAFSIAVRDENVIEQTIDLISRLEQAFKPVFDIGDFSITAQVSFGIALSEPDSTEGVTLVENAEAAMTVSKENGTSYNFFTRELEDAIGERHHLESHLANALYNNEISVHYQPIVCTMTNRVTAAEALMRWHNPVLGAVAPDRFIHLAEQNGQILALSNFVLRTAIEQAVKWRRQLGEDFRIAVNMSPVQFRDENLVTHIQKLLTYYQLPAKCLELEITEGVLLQDEYNAGKAISALQNLGVRISLDDFGTGYASMSYLQKYSFDTLKIDRSFISKALEREQDRELVRAMIAMAKKLHLHVVAEGVETKQQHEFIQIEQCNFGQGYLYGKPVPARLFEGQFLAKKVI